MIRRLGARFWPAALLAVAILGGPAARAQAPVSEAELETFLGLTPPSGLNSGDLTNLGNGPVTSGSAIMQSITVSAGAMLTFDYDFLTNAPTPSSNPLGAVDPFGFITAPALSSFVDNFYGYPNPMGAAPSGTGFLYQTGYQSFSETFATAGTYTLGIGVANVTTDAYSSALLVTDFSLTGGTLANGSFATGDLTGWSTIGDTTVESAAFGIAPPSGTYQALIGTVPEPSAILLLITGGIGAAVMIRRRRAKPSAGMC